MTKVYVDCFFYGFWIEKCDLYKYNLSEKSIRKKTDKIYSENTVQECYNEMKENNKKSKKRRTERTERTERTDINTDNNFSSILRRLGEEISKLSTLDPSYDNYFYLIEKLFSCNCLSRERINTILVLYLYNTNNNNNNNISSSR